MLTRYPAVDTSTLSRLVAFHHSSPPERSLPSSRHHRCKEDEEPEKVRWGLRLRPAAGPHLLSGAMDLSPEADLCRISHCIENLKVSGYYYEGLSWQQATLLLQNTKVGTFLVRDSENANYLFALSVQTERGPTSIRIGYEHGKFRLDSEDALICFMPLFDCVVDLIEHYMELSQNSKNSYCVWLDLTGGHDVPIRLYKPLYNRVHRLTHLCRLRLVKLLKDRVPCNHIARTIDERSVPDIPVTLREFLREYPHPH